MTRYVSPNKDCYAFSQISTWLLCEAKHYYAYQADFVPERETTAAQAKGTAVHARLEEGENILNCYDLMCLQDASKRQHELIFDTSVSLSSYNILSDLMPYRYGTVDLIYNTDYKKHVVDWKTTSSNYMKFSELAFLQTTWYAINVDAQTASIGLFKLDKGGEPVEFKHVDVDLKHYTPILVEIVKNYVDYIKKSNQNSFISNNAIKNFNSCYSYFSKCQFYNNCHQ